MRIDRIENYKKIEQLRNPFNPAIILANNNPYRYSLRRALIESIDGGCDVFLSDGELSLRNIAGGKPSIHDDRKFEGWKHES